MSILTPKTQLEIDLADVDQDVLEIAQAAHHLAVVMDARNRRFWSFPTDRLLSVLNANVPRTLSIFSANTALGTATNTALDSLNTEMFPVRAPVVPGRSDIVFDGTQFVFVPPQEPEPEPQQEPEPTQE